MSNVCICVSMCVLFHYSPAFESSMYDAKKDVVSHVNTRVSLSNQNNDVEATWSLSKKGLQVDGFLVWKFFDNVYYRIHLNASQNSMVRVLVLQAHIMNLKLFHMIYTYTPRIYFLDNCQAGFNWIILWILSTWAVSLVRTETSLMVSSSVLYNC